MSRVGVLALGAGLWLGGVVSAGAAVQFVDVTTEAGLGYLQHAANDFPFCLLDGGIMCEPERMSGGAAAGDVDGDGRIDLFVTRLDAPDLLFRNLGDGSFEDFTQAAGLAGFDLASNGAGFGDVDNDDDLDLYVTTLGEGDSAPNDRFYLFLNDGAGHFQEQALARGAAVASNALRSGISVAFGDYDRDGWLDLHVNEWRPRSLGTPGVAPHTRLLRNRGWFAPGHFEDTTQAAGIVIDALPQCQSGEVACRTWAFASSFTDLDADGWPDLAIAADFGTSQLFWNNGDGTFTDGTATAGVATDENGMGSTFGDFDADGDLDWFVTSIFDADETCDQPETVCGWGHTGNRLYRYEGNRVFSDATDDAGVREGFWGWGTAFFDADNDGDLDLVMTNGVDFPITELDAPWHADPMRYWENDGSGVFTERSAEVGLTDTGSGKGLLVFDYDSDGDLDLFVVNNAAGPRLYRNDGGNQQDWLRVRLEGRHSNAQGLGARVTLRPTWSPEAQIREVGTSTHFLGQSEPIAHFGLGEAPAALALVSVEWPRGAVQHLLDVAPNQTLVIVEPPYPRCGLLGVEPLLGIAVLARRRSRRRA